MSEPTPRDHHLPALDQNMVRGVVRQVLGHQSTERVDFHVRPASDWTGVATAGVYHVEGTARDRDREEPWSFILKVLARTAAGRVPASSDQTHGLYWRRSAFVYQSDQLDDLPGGIRGPRCYPVRARPHASARSYGDWSLALAWLGVIRYTGLECGYRVRPRTDTPN